ncbi:LOW QUALITY PROTEIN: BRD4-interacting chromatin-remodeling complex-associated protein [Leptosomus discolor]
MMEGLEQWRVEHAGGTIDMGDEDCQSLDVICDPQALNNFLHGSKTIDSDDLLDATDADSAFFEGAGLHVQESSGNHLSTKQSQPVTSVDLDFLEDDILGSPSSSANLDQPCDILQQGLLASITEQTLVAETELDPDSFQLPTLQPVVQTATDGTPQVLSGGADLIGLQQPSVLTHQAPVQQSVGAHVINRATSVQIFLQVSLGNATIQPISNLQGLPNGSPSGMLGTGPMQVVGQQVMAINQSAQIIIKQDQPSQVATVLVGSYITQTEPEQQQATLASMGVSPNASLVIKNLPMVATLNGNSMFRSVSGTQGSQQLTVTSNLSSSLVQTQNITVRRMPTTFQPKSARVLQQKLYQITPKPFRPNNTTVQQEKAQQNLTFMAGKPRQNVVLSGFPKGLPGNVLKQLLPQKQALSKPMSIHYLNQGSSIIVPAQHILQAMLQGLNQFLLSGQLAGASAMQISQQLSALQANMGGQILTTSQPSGQACIIISQGSGGQLITNQALLAQILTNQNIASQLNLGQVLTSQNAHGTGHILSAPIEPQPGQVGQPSLFQMPVLLAGSLTTQRQPSMATSLGQTGQMVIHVVTLPNQVAMLNATENLGQPMNSQASATIRSQSAGLIQPQPALGASLLPATNQSSILTIQTTSQLPDSLQLNMLLLPPLLPALKPVTSQPSPSLASSPEKIILGQAATRAVINQDSTQMFLQQLPAGQHKLPGASLSPSIPQPPLGDSPQLLATHLSQMQSPHPLAIQQLVQVIWHIKPLPPAVFPPLLPSSFLEQLHKHQSTVLYPDYKTSLRSFDNALQQLLPYHIYQGVLLSAQDYRRVMDEEFEVVSTKPLKHRQAMLNMHHLLLLEESRVSPACPTFSTLPSDCVTVAVSNCSHSSSPLLFCRVSPSAEMVVINHMFIQEEKTMLVVNKQLTKENPDKYTSSFTCSQSLSFSSVALASVSSVALAPDIWKVPCTQLLPHIHPTKLVTKHSRCSPSVTWATASPFLDRDKDTLPSRSNPRIKTYEARSCIGLKLKIKQEARLSKVFHNTALDPVHPVITVAITTGQMNGTIDHVAWASAEKKPIVTL